MSRYDQALLGIDLHESEIRAVHVAYHGNQVAKIAKATVAMPAGSINGGHVVDPGSIAFALRRLVDSIHGGGAHAVFGIQSGTTLRNLIVPPVPEAELPMVVQAEVEHQGVVRMLSGSYAYLKLWNSPDRQNQLESVVVFGVEVEITSGLRSVAERANLTVEALEPIQFALYRAIMNDAPTDVSAIALMVGQSCSEMALLCQGHLIAYRRIDTGSVALLGRSAEPWAFGFMESPAPSDLPAEESGLSLSALETMGTDLFRALDYFKREFPGYAEFDRVLLAVDQGELVPLRDELANRLGMIVELVGVPHGADEAPAALEEEARYTAAYGLALRASEKVRNIVPHVDLYSRQRAMVEHSQSRRNFGGSLIASLIAVVLGAGAFVLLQSQVASARRDTERNLDLARQVRSDTDIALRERGRRLDQYMALRREGIHLPALMDAIVASLEPGVGLTSVTVDENLRVIVSADASGEQSMIRTVQRLQHSPMLEAPILESFVRPQDGDGLSFLVSARTKPLNRFRVQPAGGQ